MIVNGVLKKVLGINNSDRLRAMTSVHWRFTASRMPSGESELVVLMGMTDRQACQEVLINHGLAVDGFHAHNHCNEKKTLFYIQRCRSLISMSIRLETTSSLFKKMYFGCSKRYRPNDDWGSWLLTNGGRLSFHDAGSLWTSWTAWCRHPAEQSLLQQIQSSRARGPAEALNLWKTIQPFHCF